MINKIEWVVGNKYEIRDIQNSFEGTLEGFILNQCPIDWKDQTSYRNHSPNDIYLVFSFNNYLLNNKKRFTITKPTLNNSIHDTIEKASSYISLYGLEYGDSIDQLIRKLQNNWIFTKQLCYDAKYQEGYK